VRCAAIAVVDVLISTHRGRLVPTLVNACPDDRFHP
jgi:hypothetical protein